MPGACSSCRVLVNRAVRLVRPDSHRAAVVVRAPALRRHAGDRRRGRACAGRGGSARIGAVLGVPAATVRGWLRRLRSCAEDMRQDAMHQLGFIAGLADPPLPALSRSPLGDALDAVAACVHAAIARFGLPRADLWALLGRFGLARHLAPARAG